MDEKNCLTGTNLYRTFISYTGTDVDATTKKLLDRLTVLERQDRAIRTEIASIHTALKIAEVKPPIASGASAERLDRHESTYAITLPFAGETLSESCQQVLRDYKGQWLSKSQVEYLVSRGGFKFTTGNPKNSVDITLRRLSDSGFCDSERVRGPSGNRYRFQEPQQSDLSLPQ